MVDGTSRHLSHFDPWKADEGYAATLERRPEELLSSHAVKRFFGAISWGRVWLLRRLLLELFVWRLRIEKPPVVVLDLDVLVMDNDAAKAREGVKPTYKKARGFAPLQMAWGRIVVDGVFSPHFSHPSCCGRRYAHHCSLSPSGGACDVLQARQCPRRPLRGLGPVGPTALRAVREVPTATLVESPH